MGSLLIALASWLSARAAGGAWLLRIDDLDAPRCPPGAAGEILRQLEAHGLLWDEAPRYQSEHTEEYADRLADLARRGLTYPCACTRARLARQSLAGPDGPVYAGTCRGQAIAGRTALRVRLGEGRVELAGLWGKAQGRDVARDIGDIVVRRADGQCAYQLACVVDEEAQGITEVIRGADLLGSSFQQQALRRLMGLAAPRYAHVPLLVDARGNKLSKQNHAEPIDMARAATNLRTCLALLGLDEVAGTAAAGIPDLLSAATRGWASATRPCAAQSSAAFPYNALQQT